VKTIEVKTNIVWGSFVAKVTPTLNATIGEAKWRVDTLNPKKILTATTENLDEEQVIRAVEKAGYKAERLS
jgi:copper chaperone